MKPVSRSRIAVAAALFLALLGSARADLIGHWRLDEGTGTTAADSTTNANNGTLVSSPAWLSGIVTNALQFTNTGQKVSIPAWSGFDLTNAITLAIWIKPTTNGSAGPDFSQFFTKGDSFTAGWGLRYTDARKIVFQMSGQYGNSIASAVVLPTNRWTHVAATFDGAKARLYINGLLDGTVNWTGTCAVNTNGVTLGGLDSVLVGSLDEARVYNNALSDRAIAELYLSQDADMDWLPNVDEAQYGTGPSDADSDDDGYVDGVEVMAGTDPLNSANHPDAGASQIGWWKLDEGTGSTTADSSGNGASGTLYNGASWTSGAISNAVFFSGSSDKIEMGDQNHLEGLPSFSASAWVKVRQFSTSHQMVTFWKEDVHFFGFDDASANRGKPALRVATNNNWQTLTTSSRILPTNEWYHVAATYTNGTVKFYVDGVLNDTVSQTYTMGSNTKQVKISDGTKEFNGTIDDVRFHSRALADGDVTALAYVDSDGDGLPNGLELRLGTNSHNVDTDGDQFNDGREVRYGTDPTIPEINCPGDGTNTTVVTKYFFDEGSGTNTVNAGTDGAAGNAAVTNGVIFSTNLPPPSGGCGWSVSFPSTGSGASTPAIESATTYDPLAGATGFVLMAWVKRESTSTSSNQSARILSDTSSLTLTNTTAGFEFRFSGSAGTLELRVNGKNATTSVGGIPPNEGNWHHVAVVYDGKRPATNELTRNVHFYVDGIQRGDGSVLTNQVVSANTNRLTVGNSSVSRGVGNAFVGTMDAVRILREFAPAAVGNGNTNGTIVCYMNLTCAPSTSELVGHWKFDEGTGTNAYDSTANDLDGALFGSPLPTWTSGVFSNALSFDGVQNEVRVPDATKLSPAEAISVSTWVKPLSTNEGFTVSKWSTNGMSGSYLLWVTATNTEFNLFLDGMHFTLAGTNTLSTNNWHLVTATYDGAAMKLYLDGTLDSTLTTNGMIDAVSDPLLIGGVSGALDDVRLYNYALAATNVLALYETSTDSDSLYDVWEINNFDDLSQTDTDDPDLDGLTNLAEQTGGTDPNDYYNGVLPNFSIFSGNNQTNKVGTVLPMLLKVLVTNAASGLLNNAPVTYAVVGGDGALTTNGVNFLSSLTARTGTDGQASVSNRLSTTAGTNLITVTITTAGQSTNVTFTEQADVDPDNDGLLNYQEAELGTDPNNPDSDGDGILDGTDPYPLDYYNAVTPTLVILTGGNQWGVTNTFAALPLTVGVTGTNGLPLTNAPISFSVTLSNAKVSTSTNGTPLYSSLQVRTQTNGQASVFLRLSDTVGTNFVLASAFHTGGTNSVQFLAHVTAADDTDGDFWRDSAEDAAGTDPNDPEDHPAYSFTVNDGAQATTSAVLSVAFPAGILADFVILSEAGSLENSITNTFVQQFNYTLQDTTQGYRDLFVRLHNPTGTNSVLFGQRLYYDTITPTITITSPTNGATTGKRRIEIQGFAVDRTGSPPVNDTNHWLQVRVGDVFANGRTNGYFWSGPYDLVEGTNTFTAVATDLAGLSVSNTVEVIYDPSLATNTPVFTSDFTNAVIVVGNTTSNFWLKGFVDDDNATVQVDVLDGADPSVTNSSAKAAVRGTNWWTVLPIGDGTNLITVTAFNSGSVSTNYTLTAIRDTNIVLEITSPSPNIAVNSSNVTIVGTASLSFSNKAITINGQTASTLIGPSDITFSNSVPLLLDVEENLITVESQGQGGNAIGSTLVIYGYEILRSDTAFRFLNDHMASDCWYAHHYTNSHVYVQEGGDDTLAAVPSHTVTTHAFSDSFNLYGSLIDFYDFTMEHEDDPRTWGAIWGYETYRAWVDGVNLDGGEDWFFDCPTNVVCDCEQEPYCEGEDTSNCCINATEALSDDYTFNSEYTFIKRWPIDEEQQVIMYFPDLWYYHINSCEPGAPFEDIDPGKVTFWGQTGFWYSVETPWPGVEATNHVAFLVKIRTNTRYTLRESDFTWPSFTYTCSDDTFHGNSQAAWTEIGASRLFSFLGLANDIRSVKITRTDPDISVLCTGCTMQLYAETDPKGRTITWSETSDFATITQGGLLTIPADAPRHTFTVRASDSAVPEVFDEVEISVFVPPPNVEHINTRYGRASPAERNLAIAFPAAFNQVRRIPDEARAMQRRLWPDTDPDPDVNPPEWEDGAIGNAFVHAYSSCLAAQRIGNVLANLFWDAHEEYTLNPCPQASMDLFNNRVGRQLGCSGRDCLARVIDAMNAGFLRWQRTLPPPDCAEFDSKVDVPIVIP